MADPKCLLGKLLVSLQLRFLIMELLNECTAVGAGGLSWGRCGVGGESPQLVGGRRGVSLQVVMVLFTVQLQNHSQQLLLGAYCHPVALYRHSRLGAALSQASESAVGELTESQGVGDPQGLGFRRLQF